MVDFWQNRDQRLYFFRELLTCSYDLYSWTYSSSLAPVFSNCPHEMVFNLIFTLEDDRIPMIAPAHENGAPVVMTNNLGLMWIADFENYQNGEIMFIHVIGPAFYDDVSEQTLNSALDRLQLSQSVKHQFTKILTELPVVPAVRFLQYGQMLHYTLTGEKIPTSDFLHISGSTANSQVNHAEKLPEARKHGTWAAEQAMMKLIEEGNLDYRKYRDKFSTSGRVGKMSIGDPIRQVKNQIIVLTALCTRAAIRGGLAPDTAYTLSDRYIQNIETCTTIADLAEVGHAMEDDFVRRVHQVKHQTGISPQIQQCCDYIQLHVEEKITVAQLANLVGHAGNYLVKKFRHETGHTISEYIMTTKMERAKLLLKDSNVPIQDIAEQLGFATQSHFGAKFKEHTGMTPVQWRTNA